MRIPFRDEIDDIFRGDRALGLKMGAGAGVAAFVVVVSLVRGIRDGRLEGVELSETTIAVVGAISAVVGAGLVLLLSLKDAVRRRLDDGRPVHRLLRLGFGMGRWSLFFWFLTAFLVTMVVTVTLATMSIRR
ncbi:MAG TPA: hypothetical protein VG406_08715 [Isosphaeraceae bacterium]|jgi:hypothetical protein|nr:hypothetical protein [Isosphaeraceae bacterium]